LAVPANISGHRGGVALPLLIFAVGLLPTLLVGLPFSERLRQFALLILAELREWSVGIAGRGV
jgi:hypothetical protein